MAQAAVELPAPFLFAGVGILLFVTSAFLCRVELSRRRPIYRQEQIRGYFTSRFSFAPFRTGMLSF